MKEQQCFQSFVSYFIELFYRDILTKNSPFDATIQISLFSLLHKKNRSKISQQSIVSFVSSAAR